MQAELSVYCSGCERSLGRVRIDTADMPEELQKKVNSVVLSHRKGCPIYSYQAGEPVVGKRLGVRL